MKLLYFLFIIKEITLIFFVFVIKYCVLLQFHLKLYGKVLDEGFLIRERKFSFFMWLLYFIYFLVHHICLKRENVNFLLTGKKVMNRPAKKYPLTVPRFDWNIDWNKNKIETIIYLSVSEFLYSITSFS